MRDLRLLVTDGECVRWHGFDPVADRWYMSWVYPTAVEAQAAMARGEVAWIGR